MHEHALLTIPQAVESMKQHRHTNISASALKALCEQTKIPGALKMHHDWLIPVDWTLYEHESIEIDGELYFSVAKSPLE
ncbi:MAG: hypothetical protein LBV76_03370 [Deltaproteobacteria bacterium]|jgi:hypothetical protein|nr:hypothetical protein [Deltaproteobacteria bacterium]